VETHVLPTFSARGNMAFHQLTAAAMNATSSTGMLPLSASRPIVPHPFADVSYLQNVIGCLATTRLEKQIGVRDLARRARLKETTIRKAEKGATIPCSHEFRAWSLALGLSWEQVWTQSLPR
jgi:hypothetical protein